MEINSIPKEALDNPAVKRLLGGLREIFDNTFGEIDKILEKNDIPIPKEIENVAKPIIKVQYANLVQTAFMESYKEYISKASLECTNNLMYGGLK